MIRALLFLAKAALLITLVMWIAEHPGSVEIRWLDYEVSLHIGVFLGALLVAFLLALYLYKFVHTFVTLPASYRRYRAFKHREKGYRALTLGLAAVAAGDTKSASVQAARARKFMPEDTGLSRLLSAQAARLAGQEEAAHDHFIALLENKDTAFLGIRGLLRAALDKKDYETALTLAQKGLAIHPKQPWILRTVYDLHIQLRQWDQAQKILRRAEKSGAISADRAAKDRTAILLAKSEEALQRKDDAEALSLAKKAYKNAPDFIPAIIALGTLYLKRGQRRKAVNLVEKAWKAAPHPALIPLWERLVPLKKGKQSNVRLHWAERLLSLKPDSAEGLLAAGQAAMREGLWGEARAYFERAEKIEPSAKLYRAFADLEDKASHDEEAVRKWLARAEEFPEEPCWICTATGRIYEQWSPVACPHGSFNTIVWASPHVTANGAGVLGHPDVNLIEALPVAS